MDTRILKLHPTLALKTIPLHVHFSPDVARHESLFGILNKGIIFRIKVESALHSMRVIFNAALGTRLLSILSHEILRKSFQVIILMGAVNPGSAWASPTPAYEDEHVSIVQFCRKDWLRINDRHFKGFWIRCEDTVRYDEFISQGNLDRARTLIQQTPWP